MFLFSIFSFIPHTTAYSDYFNQELDKNSLQKSVSLIKQINVSWPV